MNDRNLNLETGERAEPMTARDMLAADKQRRAPTTYELLGAQSKEETRQRIERIQRMQLGIDPRRPFSNYPGHAMSREIFAEIFHRAGETDIVRKNEQAELAKLQKQWDEVDAISKTCTPDGIRRLHEQQFHQTATMSADEIARAGFKTLEQFKEEGLAKRRVLRVKLREISDAGNVVYKRVIARVITILEKVFEQTEREEKAFAERTRLQFVPSEFLVAVGQFIWQLRDSCENVGPILTPPASKLQFLPKL